MYTRLVAHADGALGLQEPDFLAMPVNWVECVTLTLRHLWLQKEAAASVALQPDFPSYRQSAIMCSRLQGSSVIHMDRRDSSGTDSGWFIGCYGDGHDHNDPKELTLASLFEAAVCLDSRFVAYAALPSGCSVVAGHGSPAVLMHDTLLDITPGSFLSSMGEAS